VTQVAPIDNFRNGLAPPLTTPLIMAVVFFCFSFLSFVNFRCRRAVDVLCGVLYSAYAGERRRLINASTTG